MSGLGFALAIGVGVSLGFFGGGGSILMVPLLVYVFGLEPKTAIASSLVIVAVASVSAALQHAWRGSLDLRTALVFGSAGMLGAYTGGRVAAWIDGSLLLLLFAAMMGLTAVAMWRGRRAPASSERPPHATARLVAQGFVVGTFTGLVGAGGGFLIVPALALWAGLPMPRAIGTSLAIIVLNSVAGFSGYGSHVSIDPALVASVAALAVLGSFVGSWLAQRTDPTALRRGFAGFLVAMASLILVREGELWLGTARDALPDSGPQLVFVLAVLALGIAAGRASQRAGGAPVGERSFVEGAGI